MLYRLPAIGILFLLSFPARLQAQFTPVPLTGFTQDVIAEGGPSSLATTSTFLDAAASNKVMYSDAFRLFAALGGGGLPDNGVITGTGMTFQLAPYTANNALTVSRGQTASLDLATPASYGKLRVLCFATEANTLSPAGALVNVSVSFTDGTTVPYVTGFVLPDWFNGTTNQVYSGFGRCGRVAAAPWGVDGYPTNPRMYYIEISLACADIPKQVQRLNFTNATTSGANAPFPNVVILALGGQANAQTVTPVITPCDCNGPNGSIALTVSGGTAPYTYSWNTTPVQTGATATGLAPGTYTCTITDAGGCTSSYTGTVTLTNNAAVTAGANPAAICAGGSSTLSAAAGTGVLTSWNWMPGNLNGTTVSVTPAATTTYTLTATNALGCSATSQVTVTVNPLPAAPVVPDVAVCPGGNATMTVQGPLAGVTYDWFNSATGGASLSSGTSYTVNNVTAPATYYVEATGAGGCISGTRTAVNITVNPVPAAPTVNPVAVCPGGNATMNVQSPQAGYSYTWYAAATGGSPLSAGTSYTVNNVTAPATYYVEATNASGCISSTRTPVDVTVSPIPSAPMLNTAPVCRGANAAITVQNPQPGYTYNWYTVGTGGTPVATGTSYTVNNVTAPTLIYTEAVNAAGCISFTRTGTLVDTLVRLAAPAPSLVNTTFTSLTFSWNSVPGATGYEVTTNGGVTFSPPSSGPTGTTHTVSGLTGNTTVSFQVRALGGQPCETSPWSVPVGGTTLSSKEIFVPNVFTPNGDGHNDVLYVYGNYVSSIQFRIFNQWGQLIFTSDNTGRGWDGTYSGRQQPVGVYAYTLKVVLQDGSVINKKGSVSLIR